MSSACGRRLHHLSRRPSWRLIPRLACSTTAGQGHAAAAHPVQRPGGALLWHDARPGCAHRAPLGNGRPLCDVSAMRMSAAMFMDAEHHMLFLAGWSDASSLRFRQQPPLPRLPITRLILTVVICLPPLNVTHWTLISACCNAYDVATGSLSITAPDAPEEERCPTERLMEPVRVVQPSSSRKRSLDSRAGPFPRVLIRAPAALPGQHQGRRSALWDCWAG